MPRRLLTLCLLLPLAVYPGCRPEGYGMNCMSPTATSRPRMPVAAPAEAADPPTYRNTIRLRVIRVELPIGTLNVSEALWNYLNEEPVTVNRTAKLGRNGIRMGIGEPGSWPEVARMLEKLAGRPLSHSDLSGEPGTVLDIIVRRERPAQTISTFYDDRTVSTSDYPAGDNVLAITGAVDPAGPQGIILTGVPQIRSSQPDLPPVVSRLPVNQESLYRRAPFTLLTFRAPLAPNGFVIVGPGKAALNPATLGHQFLIEQRDGLSFETLLVLMPQVVREEIKPQPLTP